MRIVAILLVGTCLVAAGCGGGGSGQLSPAEYRAKLEALGKRADSASSTMEAALKKNTKAGFAEAMGVFADSYDELGDEIGKLDPPDDAKAANQELADALHATADAVHGLVPKIEDAPTLAAALVVFEHSEAVGAAGQQIDHALNVLKKLGYTEGS